MAKNNSSEAEIKRVVLGRIGKVHGIRGWLKLISFTTPPEKLLEYSRLLAEIDHDWRKLEIDQSRRQPGGLCVHFKGIDDPETARRFTGVELAVASDHLPELEAGDFYWHELEGMEVSNQHGQVFGIVDRLMATGANDVLVVRPTDNSVDGRERLIPYIIDSVVRRVDTANSRIEVDWEADYLE